MDIVSNSSPVDESLPRRRKTLGELVDKIQKSHLDVKKSGVDFRLADSDQDIPILVDLARYAHLESRFRDIPFSEMKVERIARRAMDDTSRHAVMLGYKNGEAIGMLYCSIGEYHIGTDVLLTTIHNLNVRVDKRMALSGGKVALGLLRGVRSWSKARGASEILLHVTSGVDLARVHKFAKHEGFQFVGGSYVYTL